MQTLEIKKSLKSDFLPFSLWFWKLSDLTYNAITGKVILTLWGYLDEEHYQKDGTKACLETKKITLDTQKELVQVPIMRPKLSWILSVKWSLKKQERLKSNEPIKIAISSLKQSVKY